MTFVSRSWYLTGSKGPKSNSRLCGLEYLDHLEGTIGSLNESF